MRKQRQKIAEELVVTEGQLNLAETLATYTACLNEIIHVFQRPMIARKLITPEENAKIFMNVQVQ